MGSASEGLRPAIRQKEFHWLDVVGLWPSSRPKRRARAVKVLLVFVLLAAFLSAPVFLLLPDSEVASCLEELADGVRPVCEPPPEVDRLCLLCLAGRSLGGAGSSGFFLVWLEVEVLGARVLEADRLGLRPLPAWPTSWASAALAGGGAPPGAFLGMAPLPEAWPASCASAARASGVPA